MILHIVDAFYTIEFKGKNFDNLSFHSVYSGLDFLEKLTIEKFKEHYDVDNKSLDEIEKLFSSYPIMINTYGNSDYPIRVSIWTSKRMALLGHTIHFMSKLNEILDYEILTLEDATEELNKGKYVIVCRGDTHEPKKWDYRLDMSIDEILSTIGSVCFFLSHMESDYKNLILKYFEEWNKKITPFG